MAASGVSVDATDSEASFFLHQQKQQHYRIASWLLLSLLLSFCRLPCCLFCPVFSAREEKLRASAIIRVGRTRQAGRQAGTVDTMYWFSSLDSLALFSFYISSIVHNFFYLLVIESSFFFLFPFPSFSQQVSLFFAADHTATDQPLLLLLLHTDNAVLFQFIE